MSEVRILQANLYVGNRTKLRAVNVAVGTGADSLGFNEGMPYIGLLAKRKAYRVLYNRHARPKRDILRGSKDTPILTLKKWPSLGEITLQVSEPSTPIKIAPARWFSASCFEHEMGRIAHICVHPNAAVKNLTTKSSRVREYAESMQSLSRLITFLKREGFIVIVSGDLNFPEGANSPGWTDPYEVFKSVGMNYKSMGIDAFAWSDEVGLVKTVEIAMSRTGSDHPWMVGTFKRK